MIRKLHAGTYWYLLKLYDGKINQVVKVATLTGRRVEAFSDGHVLITLILKAQKTKRRNMQ